MKKYIPIALIALLAGTQIAVVAGPVHDHAQQADMQGTNSDIRGNMHAQMGDHSHGYMTDRPANSEEMQKRRKLMQEQMSK